MKVIVSTLLEKKVKNHYFLFLQTRWKPEISPQYTGLIEIPAGEIEDFEDVEKALKREVKEETNLDVVNILNFSSEIAENISGEKTKIFKPFICQQTLKTQKGLPWIGFVFICKAEGKVQMDKKEAKDPRWVSLTELSNLLKKQPEKIFPLQLPVLKQYLNYRENNS